MATLYLGNQRIAPMTVETKEASKYGMTIDNMLGDVDENGVLQQPAEKFDLNFVGVEDLGQRALYYRFHASQQIRSVEFPDLKQISNTGPLDNAFGRSYIETIDFPVLENISGYEGMSYSCQASDALTKVNLSKLKTVSGYSGLNSAFVNANTPGLTDFALPSLETVSNSLGCNAMLRGQHNLSDTFNSLPKLKTISGYGGMQQFLFIGSGKSNNITSFSFPLLDVITGSSAMADFFGYRTSLQHVYFNAIKTTSFGQQYKNQFNNLVRGITGCTIHFPSNMEETISGLKGYPNFGGTSTVLAYDLSATE